jgi:hypothetical protein
VLAYNGVARDVQSFLSAEPKKPVVTLYDEKTVSSSNDPSDHITVDVAQPVGTVFIVARDVGPRPGLRRPIYRHFLIFIERSTGLLCSDENARGQVPDMLARSRAGLTPS